jgi:hypothetical protein
MTSFPAMKILLVSFVFVALLLGVRGTSVEIYNYCGQSFVLYETFNQQSSQAVCNLGPGGGSCTRSYNPGASFNLKGGPNGETLAEFTIDSNGGMDFYDVSRIVGYDFSMVLEPPQSSCAYGVCTSPSCGPPGAYAKPGDNSATHSCPTGGTFELFFCAK